MWRRKTAGMLAAFQGFHTPHGGKKTRQDVQVIYQQLLNQNQTKSLVPVTTFDFLYNQEPCRKKENDMNKNV
jgi:hypothetical protein